MSAGSALLSAASLLDPEAAWLKLYLNLLAAGVFIKTSRAN